MEQASNIDESSGDVTRRTLMRALGGAGGMIAVAGCTGGGGGDGDSGGGDDSGGGSSGKTVQFLTMGVGDNIKGFFEENNAKFEEENGYKLDFTSVTWDNAQSTLVTRVKGGKAPDVSRLPSRWIPQFQNLEAIDPLDDLMQGEFLDKFYPKVANTTKIDGSYYGVPWAYSNKAFYYNKDVFEEAGLDPENPKLDTWDDVLAAAQKVTENTDTPAYGLPAADRLTTVSQWLPYHWSHGADIINDDGKPAVNSDAGVKGLEFYSSLVTEHKVTQSSPLSSTRHDVRKLFEQGDVAMHIGHVYVGINIEENKTGTNYGIVQMPEGPDGRYSLATTDSMVMYSSAENKDAVKDLLNFYFDTDRRFEYSKKKGFMPVLEEVGNRDYFAEDPLWSPFIEASQYARSRPKLANLSEVTNRLVKAVQEAVSGRKSAEKALNEAQADLEEMIEA
ncbi:MULTISPECIES: sugar ABC transporter substrate-binding protein [unclassified Haladaptatus]|uniref:ABC transporter substrate-binding protein n=1 Tax=unclassified Haladaptatus TaxID=2622732 RepID=UPI0023E81B70|nr:MULTISPECIES: sugar ABC transporter substrate-binding protein [unclassified Haladaptatus]